MIISSGVSGALVQAFPTFPLSTLSSPRTCTRCLAVLMCQHHGQFTSDASDQMYV